MDKISIIIPVYNGEKYIERCIKSVINQTYSNIEIILINDGSTDNTLNIIKKYMNKEKRIILIDKLNEGVSAARNQGIKKATGKYICFCDADDMYDEKYIEIMYNTIKEKKTDVVRCNFKVIDNNNKYLEKGNVLHLSNKVIGKENIKEEVLPLCLEGKLPCFSYLLMIKKEALKVEYPIDIAMMEDVVFYIKLLLSIKNIYIIDNTIYTIMYNDEGATNNIKNYKRNILNIIDVNNYIKNELKKEKLKTYSNFEKLNLNHLNAISDLIFKYYLCSKTNIISFCKNINNSRFQDIVKETDLNKMNIQRKYIIKYIYNKKYFLLKFYLFLRKIIYKLRRI